MASVPPSSDLRIVIVGKTGVGKSASGNTILGEFFFVSHPSSESVTKVCVKRDVIKEGRKVSVIDTPGIMDTCKSREIVKKEIVGCDGLSTPGPHVFLLVLEVGRFTAEEKTSMEFMQELFSPKANHYTIVLFTHGDELEATEMTIDKYICDGSDELKQVLQRCGNRVHVFNNKSKDQKQVTELIKKIDELVAENGGTYLKIRSA